MASDRQCALYIYNGSGYLPTIGKEAGGPSLEIEPMTVVPVCDKARLKEALLQRLKEGNPPLVPPFPKYNVPVVVQAMGLKSWSSLVKQSEAYYIRTNNGKHSLLFRPKDMPKTEPLRQIAVPVTVTEDEGLASFLVENVIQ